MDAKQRSPALAELRQHALPAGPEQKENVAAASDASDSDPGNTSIGTILLTNSVGQSCRPCTRDGEASDSDDTAPEVPLTFGRSVGPQLPGLLKRRRSGKPSAAAVREKQKREDELWREEVTLMACKMIS